MLEKRDRWMQDFWLRDFTGDDDALWIPARTPRTPLCPRRRRKSNLCQQLVPPPSRRLRRSPRTRSFRMPAKKSALFQSRRVGRLPSRRSQTLDALEVPQAALSCLADLLLTKGGTYRETVTRRSAFPRIRNGRKSAFFNLVQNLPEIDGLDSALDALRALPPVRYTDEDWQIVRACFILLHDAAGELQVFFAETGVVDYVEVAQTLKHSRGTDGIPTDAALAIADTSITFSSTSFRTPAAASIDSSPRSSPHGLTPPVDFFVVGDPMQSIYFFRDADAELFRAFTKRPRNPDADPLLFDSVRLASNFRTAHRLVEQLNAHIRLYSRPTMAKKVTLSPRRTLPQRNRSPEPHPVQLASTIVPQSEAGKGTCPHSPTSQKESALGTDSLKSSRSSAPAARMKQARRG